MSHLYDINGGFEISESKTIISKKNFYCHNCNTKGHIYKSCNEPKISNGIIAFNIKNFKSSLTPILEKFIKKNRNNNYFFNKNDIDNLKINSNIHLDF